MVNDLISFALSAVVAFVLVVPLNWLLRKRPTALYFAALCLIGLYAYYQYVGNYGGTVAQLFAEPLRKGYIASCLLATVMFTGTMSPHSEARRFLQPVRAEMSILSCILFMPHIAAYLPSYLPRLPRLVGMGNLISYSIIVALALAAIYVALSVLSLRVVRTKMPFKVWKGIQRASYLMIALLAAHIWLAIGKSALQGNSPDTTVALVAYSCVIVAYAALRVRRAVLDRRAVQRVASAA